MLPPAREDADGITSAVGELSAVLAETREIIGARHQELMQGLADLDKRLRTLERQVGLRGRSAEGNPSGESAPWERIAAQPVAGEQPAGHLAAAVEPSMDETRGAVVPSGATGGTGESSAAEARARRAAALRAKSKGPEEATAKGKEQAKTKAAEQAKAKNAKLAVSARAARAHRIAVRREKAARASGDAPPASKSRASGDAPPGSKQ